MKTTDIPPKVRESVMRRDSYEDACCCIYCGRPRGIELHHYVERSRGGMGIEQNLVCLCKKCHTKLHNGDMNVKEYAKAYLQDFYPDWDEQELIERKE